MSDSESIRRAVLQKKNIIETTVVPNNRKDLLDMLAFSASKMKKTSPKCGYVKDRSDIHEDLGYSYWCLFSNCIQYARYSFNGDPSFAAFFQQYDRIRKNKVDTLIGIHNNMTRIQRFIFYTVAFYVIAYLIIFIIALIID